eukprot:GHVS01074537.1.p1 GENE.GHVS01074537.1~~GHVS01074537.1.p1  ORF type:complete len:187 (+),score=27.09 GHVS01074537.1:25-561(+)
MADTASEVRMFVSFICSFVLYGVYLLWALAPDSFLISLGIEYYPDRYWALAVPAYIIVSFLCGFTSYIAVNLIVTPPLNSLKLVSDEYSRLAPLPPLHPVRPPPPVVSSSPVHPPPSHMNSALPQLPSSLVSSVCPVCHHRKETLSFRGYPVAPIEELSLHAVNRLLFSKPEYAMTRE